MSLTTLPLADEVEIFEAAYHQRGPSAYSKARPGTGKTRFVEHMSWRLGQQLMVAKARKPSSMPSSPTACPDVVAAGNRGMPRGPHRVGPHWTLSARPRWHPLAGRAVD